MKNQLSLIVLLFIFGISSCAPKKDEAKEMASDNNKQIEKLLKKIQGLKKQIESAQVSDTSPETLEGYDLEELSNLRGSIDELRSDLLRYIKQVEKSLTKKITTLDSKFLSFKNTLNDNKNTYVKLEDFQVLKQDIIKSFETRQNLISAELTATDSSNEIKKLKLELTKLENAQKGFTKEYKSYFSKALGLWDKKLKSYVKNEISISNEEFKTFVSKEISRLNIEIENNKIKLNNKISLISTQYSTLKKSKRDSLEKEITELERAIDSNKDLLSSIKDETKKSKLPRIFNDIMEKEYAPCFNGLKDVPHCFTVGSMITRLGGVFVDSAKFKRTKLDFLRYLTLSGLKNSPIQKNTKSYLHPSSKNLRHFKTCHPGDDEYLLPPTELWPRGVLLALILQNIEKDLVLQKKLKITKASVTPVTGIVSWYRSKCYQNRIKGINTKTIPKSKWPKAGDHIYAAAFDLKFSDQANTETHEFYVNYVKEQIIENDIYEVTHPLKSANFKIFLGFGHGAKSRLHLGITSEQARWNPEFKY